MSNVIKLFNDGPAQLRAIADEMEADPKRSQTATVIWGQNVYQCMDEKISLEQASLEAVFNCNFAIAKMMCRAVGATDESDDE